MLWSSGSYVHLIRWMEDFLSDRTQQVLVHGKVSWLKANVASGVPHDGSVLGPLLFLVFINDLPDWIKTSTTHLFADDCVLYKMICSHNNTVQLQEDLNWKPCRNGSVPRSGNYVDHPAKCQVNKDTKNANQSPSPTTSMVPLWKRPHPPDTSVFMLMIISTLTPMLTSSANRQTPSMLRSSAATLTTAVERSRRWLTRHIWDLLQSMQLLHGTRTQWRISGR